LKKEKGDGERGEGEHTHSEGRRPPQREHGGEGDGGHSREGEMGRMRRRKEEGGCQARGRGGCEWWGWKEERRIDEEEGLVVFQKISKGWNKIPLISPKKDTKNRADLLCGMKNAAAQT
jgi:hypothetical protein